MRSGTTGRGKGKRVRALTATAMLGAALAACGGESSGDALTWYINPDVGGQEEIAARCSEQSGGRYTIEASILPEDATLQREQLIRRLAGEDASVDLMSLDPPFQAEFAAAGFLYDIPDEQEKQLTQGVVKSAIKSATWDGELVTVPFWINTQLLWYRKSVAKEAGLDMTQDVTWEQIMDAAEKTDKTIGVQANRYEGYTVWINALVESAGGSVLANETAGPDGLKATIDSPAGQEAAGVIAAVADRKLGGPTLSTSDEEASRALFQGPNGGFLVNWPYVWPTWLGEVEAKTLDQAVVDDIGWTLYPRVSADQPSEPPVGGINIGIGAFSEQPELALEAAKCITNEENQAYYFINNGSPATLKSVYDDKEVKKTYPMADTLLASMDQAAPRPQTPYYSEVSFSLQSTFHPPSAVNPDSTPKTAAELIIGVIQGDDLL